jgi:tRNA threonylcarbamoyl adenosine modification protein YeaZ
MNILALDTTQDALSVALNDREIAKLYKAPHDETMPKAVESLLKKSGLELKDLDAIACAAGPGRFTGIRIGMSYAAVAAWKLKIPALAVSRFEAAAWKKPGPEVCVSLKGYKDERFYQVFKGNPPKPAGPAAWVDAAQWSALKFQNVSFDEPDRRRPHRPRARDAGRQEISALRAPVS